MPTYRTSDAARWGAGKEAPLSAAEVDANFWEAIQAITAIPAGAAGVGISNITVIGTQMTIHLTDGGTFGPFTLPVALLHWRGEWVAATAYEELDIVRSAAYGAFVVLRPHTSGATFDPNAADAGGNALYHMLLPAAASAAAADLVVTEILTANHDVASVDAHGYLVMNSAGANTVTFYANALVPLNVGTVITIEQGGVGQTTIVAAAGVTIRSPESLKLRKEHAVASMTKVAADVWTLIGDLEGVV